MPGIRRSMSTTSGRELRRRGDRLRAVGGLADHLDPAELEDHPQAVPHQVLVVDDAARGSSAAPAGRDADPHVEACRPRPRRRRTSARAARRGGGCRSGRGRGAGGWSAAPASVGRRHATCVRRPVDAASTTGRPGACRPALVRHSRTIRCDGERRRRRGRAAASRSPSSVFAIPAAAARRRARPALLGGRPSLSRSGTARRARRGSRPACGAPSVRIASTGSAARSGLDAQRRGRRPRPGSRSA